MVQSNTDTIIALATPSGSGAIGVIRLSGPEAIDITNKVFRGKNLSKQASHTIHFGTIRDGETILDEVLVSIFVGPHSYTKENVVEISTHGSAYIVGGFGMTVIKRSNIVMVPIRSGVGARLGINIGYLKFTNEPTWNPF